ncbi:ACP5 [Symbiodinium sp. CCMP2592]|nr:ACP5 [Symbiodinium sp. CCMP2592]
MVASWLILGLALPTAAQVNRSSHFLSKQSVEVSSQGARCGGLDLPENAGCKQVVEWAAGGGKWDSAAGGWYKNMPSITGVNHEQGTLQDFQRLYYCSPPGDSFCGLPPCTGCSNPPCSDCFAGNQLYSSLRPGCDGNDKGVGCVPPKTALGYKGQHWPTTVIHGTQEMHIFAIGDWGGMDGSLDPPEGRKTIVAYDWGRRPGPSVFPRSRWNKMHTVQFCDHKQLVECFNTRGQAPCTPECGYVAGVDDQPQLLVANAFKARAALVDPQYILNVGDNFYWGGIEKTCGSPMDQISYPTKHQFDQIFEGVYQGAGLTNKPWFSVLGNHDWGGFKFDNGWDQQISYTWASNRWVMPAPYYKTSVVYADLGFDVDYFFLDSNFIDAMPPEEDPNHNMCSRKNNKPSASCAAADGPESVDACPGWFASLWAEQKPWVTQLMGQSKANWQIVVTHFPCGHEQDFYKSLQGLGMDLLVTGHRHDQELWLPDDYAKNHMGVTCIVTGGGGGITSEATPNPEETEDWYGEGQYGFYDLTISKSEILIESINYDGEVLLTHTVHPSR